MNYAYNNFSNPYNRPFNVPNYAQPQYSAQMQQPLMQPQQQMSMQQPMQYEIPIQYVGNGTLKEAEGYILFPNQKAIFVDKANGMIYEKVSGNDGQSFMVSYRRVEDDTVKKEGTNVKEESAINMAEYAKKTDLNSFVTLEQYNELKELYNALNGQLNAPKQTAKTKAEKND